VARELVTRDRLRRELVANAATKPLNVIVPATVVVAGLLLGTWWLVPVAVVVYLALGAFTLFDQREAERVGTRTYAVARGDVRRLDPGSLAPEIAGPVRTARAEEKAIRETVAKAHLPFEEVSGEIDGLMGELDRIAGRAQLIYDYLSSQDAGAIESRLRALRAERSDAGVREARDRAIAALEEQRQVQQQLYDQLERFYAEMEHLAASLGTVHGQLVRMSVAEEAAGQTELAKQVRDLRDRVKALAQGMTEAYAQVSST
jgi:hypothetical protein